MKSMTTLRQSSLVVRKRDLLESSVDQETVLLSIANSNYYGMDPVAGRIWALIEQPISVTALLDVLRDEYDVGADECRRDVMAFLGRLQEERLIDVSDG